MTETDYIIGSLFILGTITYIVSWILDNKDN